MPGLRLFQPDWNDWSHSIALSARLPGEQILVHLIFNAYWEQLDFELPEVESNTPWRRWIDTALEPFSDIVQWQQSPPISGATYKAEARSVVVLFKDVTA